MLFRLARLLDARRQHLVGRLARLRRSGHHGVEGQPADGELLDAPRPAAGRRRLQRWSGGRRQLHLAGRGQLYGGYHTYAIDWSPGKITWSIDGVAYLTETPSSPNFTAAGGNWVFDNHPFYLIFDICQGGPFASTGHNITQPLNMDIAYVNVCEPGDANGDGRMDVNDLTIVLANYNQTGMSWSQGDFNNNGKVDVNDLTTVLANYNWTAAVAGVLSVPEPAACTLLSIAAALLIFAWRPYAGRRRDVPPGSAHVRRLPRADADDLFAIGRRRRGRFRGRRRRGGGRRGAGGRQGQRGNAPGKTKFPAASRRPVHLDQAGGDLALRLGQRVFQAHQVLLQERDARQIGHALRVLGQHDVHGPLGVGHAGRLRLRPPLGPQERHQAVLHVLVGAEHRIAVGGHQLLETGVLEADVIDDPAVVEDVPRERRADAALEGLFRKRP